MAGTLSCVFCPPHDAFRALYAHWSTSGACGHSFCCRAGSCRARFGGCRHLRIRARLVTGPCQHGLNCTLLRVALIEFAWVRNKIASIRLRGLDRCIGFGMHQGCCWKGRVPSGMGVGQEQSMEQRQETTVRRAPPSARQATGTRQQGGSQTLYAGKRAQRGMSDECGAPPRPRR